MNVEDWKIVRGKSKHAGKNINSFNENGSCEDVNMLCLILKTKYISLFLYT